MKIHRYKISFQIILLLTLSIGASAQKNTNERARWFTDARYGMFIHWGVYSGAEGVWKGEKLRNNKMMACCSRSINGEKLTIAL